MSAPVPPRLLDAARRAARSAPDDHVWHFVMHRAGTAPARGERLATLALSPADVARIGRAELAGAGVVAGDGDAEAVGLRIMARALEGERRTWVRRLIRAGYADGYGVAVIAERGYRRTVFPGVGLAALAGSRLAIVTPGGNA